MSDVTRRDVVKLAAGMSIAVAAAATGEARCQDKPADQKPVEIPASPVGFVFGEQVTFKTDPAEPNTFELIFTSAHPVGTYKDGVHVRLGTSQMFRARADVDEFTKQGGIHWKCGNIEGKVQFKTAGALVLVVREHDGTVRCYSLTKDFRC